MAAAAVRALLLFLPVPRLFLPARLLLPGQYFITLALHTPKTKLYDLRKQALGFRIVATMADRFDGFAGEELGQIFADVKWQRIENVPTTPHRETAIV